MHEPMNCPAHLRRMFDAGFDAAISSRGYENRNEAFAVAFEQLTGDPLGSNSWRVYRDLCEIQSFLSGMSFTPACLEEAELAIGKLEAILQGAIEPTDPSKIAEEAIGLFLEYRDQHGYDEEIARAKAVCEVLEGQ